VLRVTLVQQERQAQQELKVLQEPQGQWVQQVLVVQREHKVL